MLNIIDTHTHLNSDELYPHLDEIVERCHQQGVIKVINNADTFESMDRIEEIAQKYPDFAYSALGIFPTTDYDNLEEVITKLEERIKVSHNVVAIGEIGLDYHLDNSKETKEKQKALFLAQIKLAEKLNLPIIVHSRDAEADTFNTIINSKFQGNVTLHCYSGSFQMALRYLRHKKNIYFGIGGVLTFKNAVKLVEVASRVPSDHFLLETDAPYLSPVPFRGKINEPSYIVKTLDKLAELLNTTSELLAPAIYERSKEVYHL